MLRRYRGSIYFAIVLFAIILAGGAGLVSSVPWRSDTGTSRPGMVWPPTSVAPPPDARTVIQGKARAVDGDSLVIGSQRIRLFGIDAPELNQTCAGVACGREAHRGLSNLVSGREVRCVGESIDRYARLVATCHLNTEDIGKVMVRNGMAFAYQAFSNRYVNDELMAKSEQLGVWARPGTVAPWLHRKANRTSGS